MTYCGESSWNNEANYFSKNNAYYTITLLLVQSAERIADEAVQVSDVELLDMQGMSGRIQLEFVTGTMLRERVSGFMRLLWCACRGNAFFKFVDMPEDVEDITTVSIIVLVILSFIKIYIPEMSIFQT